MIRWYIKWITLLAAVVFLTSGSYVQASKLDNFTIKQFTVNLKLGKNDEGRSTLLTTETIVVDFPPRQNKGILRTFVKEYDGHTTNLNVISVTDGSGKDLNYTWEEDTIRIAGNDYVEGERTYKITYSQQDVTRFYKDTDKQEFYWDAIGVEWRVPIEQATVSLELSDGIAGRVRTEFYCYKGKSGSSDNCDSLFATRNNPVTQWGAQASNLPKLAGVTVAIGFEPGTFAEYEPTLLEKMTHWWIMSLFLTTPVGLLLMWFFERLSKRLVSRELERGTVVTEFIPPPEASVITAASTLKSTGPSYNSNNSSLSSDDYSTEINSRALTAQLIDLAVRKYILIRNDTKKGLVNKQSDYKIELIRSIDSLTSEEKALLHTMYGRNPGLGDVLTLKDLIANAGYTKRLNDFSKELAKGVVESHGIYETSQDYQSRFKGYAKKAMILGILLLSPFFAVVAINARSLSRRLILSDKGLNLSLYLKGLEKYIKVAEADRINMLQTPEATSRLAAADINPASPLKLFERNLPYAILFGQEKGWLKQLGSMYESAGQNPEWINDPNGVGGLAGSVAALGSVVSAGRASSYSSSSGGSSGGGFSGGGGGGGGGGGA